jgi:asparagine synthetase B (glutamine-hydrolysing)
VNGEIYNHEALKAGMRAHKYNTQSDCEVIAHLVSDGASLGISSQLQLNVSFGA